MIDTKRMLSDFEKLTDKQKQAIYNMIITFADDCDDNDFTAEEMASIDEGIADVKAGRVYKDSEINWEKIGKKQRHI